MSNLAEIGVEDLESSLTQDEVALGLTLGTEVEQVELYSGTWQSILWEIRNGDIFTVLDELWHTPVLDWLLPGLHWRFCQWSHTRQD